MRVFPLYFLPIAYAAARYASNGAAIGLALFGALVWIAANWDGQQHERAPWIMPFNVGTMAIAFATVGLLVTQLKRRLLAVEGLSRQDHLTTLLNGRAFYEQADLLLALARRSQRPITFAYLDLDNFKQVNDQQGHQEGDRALKLTASEVKRHVRQTDVVARLGGDEFALLLPDTDATPAQVSLDRVRTLVTASLQEQRWPVTLSVGAVTFRQIPATVDEAIKRADAVMYRAKSAGKNRVYAEVVE